MCKLTTSYAISIGFGLGALFMLLYQILKLGRLDLLSFYLGLATNVPESYEGPTRNDYAQMAICLLIPMTFIIIYYKICLNQTLN
jgi:hypothetical protein